MSFLEGIVFSVSPSVLAERPCIVMTNYKQIAFMCQRRFLVAWLWLLLGFRGLGFRGLGLGVWHLGNRGFGMANVQ